MPLEGVTSSGQVTLTVTDDGIPSASDTEMFTIAVTTVNDGPEITTSAPATATVCFHIIGNLETMHD